MVTLQEITRENYQLCINLKADKGVAPNVYSLAQSKYEPECIPLAIYNDDVMVGFLMYCISAEESEYWVYRLMIDEKYQRRGYAYEAMQILLKIITTDKTHNKIYIDTGHDNIAALNLYEKLGFIRTDEWVEKDCVFMRFDY